MALFDSSLATESARSAPAPNGVRGVAVPIAAGRDLVAEPHEVQHLQGEVFGEPQRDFPQRRHLDTARRETPTTEAITSSGVDPRAPLPPPPVARPLVPPPELPTRGAWGASAQGRKHALPRRGTSPRPPPPASNKNHTRFCKHTRAQVRDAPLHTTLGRRPSSTKHARRRCCGEQPASARPRPPAPKCSAVALTHPRLQNCWRT